MFTLLLVVIICGIIAWVVNSTPIPQLFKTIAFAILAIIVIIAFFQIVLHTGLPVSIR